MSVSDDVLNLFNNRNNLFKLPSQKTLAEKIADGSISQPVSTTNEVQEELFTPSAISSVVKNNLNNPGSPILTNGWQDDATTPITQSSQTDVVSQELQETNANDNPEKQWISWFWSNLKNSMKASNDYEAKKKQIALWYDEDSEEVLYLDLDESEWITDSLWGTIWTREAFEQAYENYLSAASDPTLSEQEQAKLLLKFYDDTKWLFRLKWDDWYSDAIFFQTDGTKMFWKRKDQYSEETLKSLAANGTKAWRFEPTFNEWRDYIQTQAENEGIQKEILEWYGIASDTTTTELDLEDPDKSQLNSLFDRAMAWVLPAITENIPAAETHHNVIWKLRTIAREQLSDIDEIAQWVYNIEKLVLLKPESERNEYDKEVVTTANAFRQMEKDFADWLNDFFLQTIKGWIDENWQLTNLLDIYEDWKELWEVLWDKVREDLPEWVIEFAPWKTAKDVLDKSWSVKDIFQELNNRVRYHYYKNNVHDDSRWGRRWDDWQRFRWLAEESWMEIWQNVWQSISSLWDNQTEYSDQDITKAKLLDTNWFLYDYFWGDTIYKYIYWLEELWPETAWSLWVMWLGSKWFWAAGRWTGFFTSVSNNISRSKNAINAIKALKWWTLLERMAALDKAMAWAATWTKKLSDISKALTTSEKRWIWTKLVAQKLDKLITEGIVDQTMDAMWSPFDTEAYSPLSMQLSLWWTLGLTMLPELNKGKALTWWLTRSVRDTWNGIWDMVDFLTSSKEWAEQFYQAFWKDIRTMSLTDLENFRKRFKEMEWAAIKAYNQLPDAWKEAAWQWTKQMMYDYIAQAFGSNSEIAKSIRTILMNKKTNPADIIKYIGKNAWTVSFGPYISTIKFKQWTRWLVSWAYDPSLDALGWGFASRLSWGFTQDDINKLSKISHLDENWNPKDYGDIVKNQDKLFYKSNWKFYLTEEWLERFWLSASHESLESLGISLARAEEVKEILREKMKWMGKLSDEVIDDIAETWAYDEVLAKMREIVC